MNDNLDVGARDPNIGAKLKHAAQLWRFPGGPARNTDIMSESDRMAASYGSIVSVDHMDSTQVVIVDGNVGWRIDNVAFDNQLPRQAVHQMIECLKRNGYNVRKSHKPKKTPEA